MCCREPAIAVPHVPRVRLRTDRSPPTTLTPSSRAHGAFDFDGDLAFFLSGYADHARLTTVCASRNIEDRNNNRARTRQAAGNTQAPRR